MSYPLKKHTEFDFIETQDNKEFIICDCGETICELTMWSIKTKEEKIHRARQSYIRHMKGKNLQGVQIRLLNFNEFLENTIK